MPTRPLVSVIIIFLNAGDFLAEAVESVLAQTYQEWELFLVDDGATDGSTQTACRYAAQHPGKIFYLEHPGHMNWGKGASRNLGIRQARGEYIAFLDADDVWLPHKLEQQTVLLSAHPQAGMLYGDTLYWFSWTGSPEAKRRDFIPNLGVETGIPIDPPRLIPLYLQGKAAVPCTCSVLVRRDVVVDLGGFDETAPEIMNFYEDQAFYAKICLAYPVIAAHICWDKYRQRPPDHRADIARIANQERLARRHFLRWLDEYTSRQGLNDPLVRRAIRKEQWLAHSPAWLPQWSQVQTSLRWVKKWLLRIEERILHG